MWQDADGRKKQGMINDAVIKISEAGLSFYMSQYKQILRH